MAIAGIPQNFNLQQGNQQTYLSWDIMPGATSYNVQRSLDGNIFTTIASPVVNNYLDTSVTIGILYYYQIASVNISGTSGYTPIQSIVPAPTAEMSLGELRLRAQQRADRVNSNFVTLTEWNSYINQCMYELYDLLITVYEDYFIGSPAGFMTTGNQYQYSLPDGSLTFTDINGNSFIAPPFYKLMGVDLGLNNANNAWVTVAKFNFIDRNRFIYPNTASTIYGVFNLQYRVLGNKIEFVPTPSANQPIRLWYAPRLAQLLKDTDLTTIGFSGWLEYVIVKAAYLALTKEESDTSALVMQLAALQKRIEESASNRDAGMPDKISDVRTNGLQGFGNSGYGFSGPIGGY